MNFKLKPLHASVKWSLFASIFIASAAAWADAEPSLNYTIRPSDKLIRLSREILVSPSAWNEVAKLNQLKDPNAIRSGQTLSIPLRLLRSQPAPARLISATGDVQLGGQRVESGAAITEGSQLRTGPNSSAVVELGDGSQVKLLPNTLGDVLKNRNYALRDAGSSASTTWFSGLIRLAQGSMETLASKTTRRAEPLQIKTATSVVGVRGTQFRVTIGDGPEGVPRSEVIEGLVRADNTAQQSAADLPKGTGAVIDPKVKDIKVTPLLPAPSLENAGAELFKPQAELAWGSVPGASAYRVQVASDAGFDKIVREYRVVSANANLADLPSGAWHARVRGIDGQGIEGFDSVKLVAVRDAKPAPRWQASNARLTSANGSSLLGFTALHTSGDSVQATSYSAELAKDAAFSQIIKRASGPQALVDLGALEAGGTYFLRLRASLDGNRSIESETYSFELPGNWGATVTDVAAALRKVP